MKAERTNRRRHPRVKVGGKAHGKVNAIHNVSLLDISLGGALIEHAHVAQPGIVFDLFLTLLGRKMRLKCRVIRSTVHRSEAQAYGERKLFYRTGLEFVGASEETRQAIADFITSVIEGENGSGAGEPGRFEPLEQGRLRPKRLAHGR